MSGPTEIQGYPTTLTEMFGHPHGETVPITRIEIPMIQRDYAQGREDKATTEIRTAFVDALLDALSSTEPLGLDFVYGKVEETGTGGVFHPLDGQQRLTTLFLLHWYLASETDQFASDAPWMEFTYATRPSARRFCEMLASKPLPPGTRVPSKWLTDQPWYQYGWQFDPTVSSMLVMLDSIADAVHGRGSSFDPDHAWERLAHPDSPGVSFYLLPLGDMYSDEELYITMNSRGRPLTEFENFKAQLEQIISHSPRSEEFRRKVDAEWADLMWRLDDGDRVIDDEFLRYFTFLIEICEFRQNIVDGEQHSLVKRAAAVFGDGNTRSSDNLDLVIAAFDIWSDAQAADDFFARYFSDASPGDDGYAPDRIRVFGRYSSEEDTSEKAHPSRNLLRHCLQTFGKYSGRARRFTLGHSLLLYGVLQHRFGHTSDFENRLRSLRNLVGASDNEIRTDRMPKLLADVERVIVHGQNDQVKTLSANQRSDELRKQEFLRDHPELRPVLNRLEDHRILEGNLSVFDLGTERLRQRAADFERVFDDDETWHQLTGALLASGDYFRRPRGWWQILFGPPRSQNSQSWQILFTSGTLDEIAHP